MPVVAYAQCENFRILLPLRFYVKSTQKIIEVQKLPLLTHQETLTFYFDKSWQFLKAEICPKTKFRASDLKLDEMVVFEILESLKLISRKIRVAVKF